MQQNANFRTLIVSSGTLLYEFPYRCDRVHRYLCVIMVLVSIISLVVCTFLSGCFRSCTALANVEAILLTVLKNCKTKTHRFRRQAETIPSMWPLQTSDQLKIECHISLNSILMGTKCNTKCFSETFTWHLILSLGHF